MTVNCNANGGFSAERPGQRVAERERRHAEDGAPRNPAQLAARRQRRQLAKRPHQDDQRDGAADEEIDELCAIEQTDARATRTRRMPRRASTATMRLAAIAAAGT